MFVASRCHQQGLTLVELMIGMVIGLLVVAIAIQMYISTLGITRQTTAMTRLNQELRSTIDLISTDIKRAGYYSNSVAASNPYASIIEGETGGALPIDVFDEGATNEYGCVILGYENDRPSPLVDEHLYGYKLVSGQIHMLTATSFAIASPVTNCGDVSGMSDVTGSWDALTDSRTVSIDSLVFTLDPATSTAWSEASSKSIEIRIVGTAVADSKVRKEVRELVRVRNEYAD